jgi:pyridinium-3,5-biscarboxylic acid mononucleotide sulfurtransferase
MTALESSAIAKERKLLDILASMESAIVAFSGGVDSAYLAVVARQALGERTLAVTGASPSYPAHQRRMALEVVEKFELAHRFVATEEIENPEYLANHPDRCFHCKSELYTRLKTVSAEGDFRFILDGANADDRLDFRPGRRAAKLMGVRSPLEEVELTKAEIRFLSEKRELPTATEPASACLASRVPYESPITIEKLDQVEKGEEALRRLGFRHMRLRHHDAVARLEFAPEELPRALEPSVRARLVAEIKKLGYRFVTVDLEGYRTGSLNEVLEWPSRSVSKAPGIPTTAKGDRSK